MDGVRLADRLAYGAGCAARRVGFLHDAYRPDGPEAPIDLAKRFLRLPSRMSCWAVLWPLPVALACRFGKLGRIGVI
jgi:hypothetical protein